MMEGPIVYVLGFFAIIGVGYVGVKTTAFIDYIQRHFRKAKASNAFYNNKTSANQKTHDDKSENEKMKV